MKVLYCSPVFLDYRLPFFKELVRLFDRQFSVMYSTNRYHLMKRDPLCRRIKEELGQNAYPFKHDYMFDTATMSFKRMEMEYGQKIPVMFGFLSSIRKQHPTVLISEAFFQWTPWCLLYSILFRVPLYISYERTCYTERGVGRVKTWYRKWVDKIVKGYLVNGIETQKYLESIGIDIKKIHRIGISADSSGLRTAIDNFDEHDKLQFRKKYMADNEGLLFLFSGQIVKRKGVDHLLAAWMTHMEKYPNDRLVLIGGGDMYGPLSEKYGDLDSVFMEGRVEYDSVYKYYSIADVFILPTIEDNWSLVIPEAMACGLPVATSIYNGCYPELVHENGITFDTFNHDSILQALDWFHHQNLNVLGHKSMEIEKKYNTENCARRMFDVLIRDNE